MFKNFTNILLMASLAFVFMACPDEKAKGTIVRMSTSQGDIDILLYEETPLHKENFLKLVEEKYYDSVLFHRVINQFMIQGGDPESKNAASGTMLGNGGPSYTVPAEFNPKFIHKKGALSAARQGDQINPNKESSGSQFYLVQGKVYDSTELVNMIKQMNMRRAQTKIQAYLFKPENSAELEKARNIQMNQPDSLEIFIESLKQKIGVEEFSYTPEQIKTYTTIGGTPFLDMDYTVYGEIVNGLDVVDKIASVATDGNDRPVEDIRILSVKVIKK